MRVRSSSVKRLGCSYLRVCALYYFAYVFAYFNIYENTLVNVLLKITQKGISMIYIITTVY